MRRIAESTVTRGLTYLYRWWLQAELRIVPEAYIRREGVGTLISRGWSLIGSSETVSEGEILRVEADLARPVFAFTPGLPLSVPGIDLRTQSPHDLTEELDTIASVLAKHQKLLQELGEEDADQNEWWRTRDSGRFKVWKGRAHRVLLYPDNAEVYGYRITAGDEGGYFVYRSRSCKEEGRLIHTGVYKTSEHQLRGGRKVTNLDLIFGNGGVLLLWLLPVGAGYKLFLRRVPGFDGSLD